MQLCLRYQGAQLGPGLASSKRNPYCSVETKVLAAWPRLFALFKATRRHFKPAMPHVYMFVYDTRTYFMSQTCGTCPPECPAQ
jgi:hypothetical protein